MISKNQIKWIRQLEQKKFRKRDGLFVAGKAGFCLDPVHWEIRYDIPFLETVTQDRIITREDVIQALEPVERGP